ncbi:hypothetical protein KKC13_07230 [bacterium]|nr:hypothetical protein [bacterium]MBU1958927.1 hypothetical protein [bacterium]
MNIKTTIGLGTLFFTAIICHAGIGGIVHEDLAINGDILNSNTYGVQDSNELGVEGITVTAYSIGTANSVLSTTTQADGSWNLATTGNVRVEFSNWPKHLQESPLGTTLNSSVQFINNGDTNVNFGLHNPENFIPQFQGSDRPLVFTPETKFGPAIGSSTIFATAKGTVAIPFGSNGNSPVKSIQVPFGQVGSTYGVAHRKSDNALFVSSFQKASSGFGPNASGTETTTGAIYHINQNAQTATLFTDFNTATGTDPHPLANVTCTGTGNDQTDSHLTCWLYDNSGSEVGKMGLGDLELSADGTKLFSVNLKTQNLISVELSTPIQGTIPTAGATAEYNLDSKKSDCRTNVASDWRPFALGTHNGKMYLGVTCTAESSFSQAVTAGTVTNYATAIQDDAHDDMEAIIYEFNPDNPSLLSEVTRFDLDYSRQGLIYKSATRTSEWHPWTFDERWQKDTGTGDSLMLYPTPLVSDIEFVLDRDDNRYDMVIGIKDRTADQYGWRSGNPHNTADTNLVATIAAGEELRLCNLGTHYELESSGICTDGTAGGAGTQTPDGPNGGEYYSDDFLHHAEIFFGSSFHIAGSDSLGTAGQNYTDGFHNSGGIGAWDNDSGIKQWGARVYTTPLPNNQGTLSKANGLGDIEYISSTPAPLEIGNRIWADDNGNCIQDANESGIDDVDIELIKNNNSQETTTSADNGHYLFSNLTPNTNYVLRISNLSTQTPLNGKELTVCSNNGGEGANKLLNNSDATMSGSNAEVSVNSTDILTAGANNHSFDIGFKPINLTPPTPTPTTYSLGDKVWLDSNKNGVQDNGELGVGQVKVTLYNTADCTGDLNATTTTSSDGLYQFSNLITGSYCVAFTELPQNHTITTANQGSDDALNSDADSNAKITNINLTANDPDKDMGIYPTVATYTLGDKVWLDSNKNGIQDNGELGVGQVKVNLYTTADCSGDIKATTTTLNNGFYQFSNLTTGDYCVAFTELPANYSITTANQGSDDALNSDADSNTKISNINLTANDPDEDMGIYPTPNTIPTTYTLGQIVWLDSNKDGVQNNNEPGVAEVTVNLYNTADCTGEINASTTTTNTGFYQFTNLVAGAYCIEFTNFPQNHSITTANQGSDDTINSDADSSAKIMNINLTQDNPYQGIGIYPTPTVVGGIVDVNHTDGSCGCHSYETSSVSALDRISILLLTLLTSFAALLFRRELELPSK